jgi:hypothetical protein
MQLGHVWGTNIKNEDMNSAEMTPYPGLAFNLTFRKWILCSEM